MNLLGCLDRATTRPVRPGRPATCRKLDDDELSEIRSRYLGFIFQSYNLIAQLTVVENIELPLYYQGNISREAKRALHRDGRDGRAGAIGSITGRFSSPAVSSSAWPSPGRWSTIRT